MRRVSVDPDGRDLDWRPLFRIPFVEESSCKVELVVVQLSRVRFHRFYCLKDDVAVQTVTIGTVYCDNWYRVL